VPLQIGFVENSFTGAAYRSHGFYDFYHKYQDELRDGKNITNDLSYLKVKIPKYSPQYQPSLLEDLPTHIKQLFPSANVSVITDLDVHNGAIFNHNHLIPKNAYDILVLGHQEYVTQEEYSNLKTYVLNGGTLIIPTGNVFYAEVKYDPVMHDLTLVKGHDVTFNGKVAHKGISERWKNETKQWLGSNFYPIYTWQKEYHKLYNNPFNFTGLGGGEEQYYDKNNHDIRIILDYKSSDERYPIATYELKYGEGKVIVIGLAAEDILDPCIDSCHKFYDFIDHLFLNYALDSTTYK